MKSDRKSKTKSQIPPFQWATGFVNKYLKELLIAFAFAIVAAVVYESYLSPEKSAEWIAEKNMESIVTIEVFDTKHKIRGTASGFFIDKEGRCVTNYHVIKGAADLRARLNNGAYYDWKEIRVALEEVDIAILQFEGKDFIPSNLGNSDNIRPGDKVVVIGNPLGLEHSISEGLVSSFSRDIGMLTPLIQIDAPVSSGSNGSPVFNEKGEVIGIISTALPSILPGGELSQNVNFAIPINVISKLLRDQIKKEVKPKEYFYSVGLMEVNRGNYKQAEENFTKAIHMDNEYLDAYLGLADIYYEQRNYDKELDICKKALKIAPDKGLVHFYLAWAYEDKGEYDLAVNEYEKAIELDPENMNALYSLGILYLVKGEHHKALELGHRLKRLNPAIGDEIIVLANRIK